ncbi:vacuolar protein sorting-associated protein 54 [Atheta coriaria]|uniref:vacuolar protein sorting-associated protein 54 n=1 Tax=Dalotia coriaria TaxID=877792 RepID=UPI0031F46B0C
MSESSSSTSSLTAPSTWSLYSASQNLAGVLNDPNKGKQTNFFIRTWGDGFVEKSDIEKSPFLPDINHTHFDSYLKKVGKRFRRHRRLSSTKSDAGRTRTKSESNAENVDSIPEIFLKGDFPLSNPKVFSQVFGTLDDTSFNERSLHESLTHYLDIVEVQIAKQVSQKSGAFFHAMTSHDTIMEQMGTACGEVRQLRGKIKSVDENLAKNPLKLLALARSRSNRIALVDKIKFMSTVLQTQPTLQLLLSSSDYVAALELIESTQQVLARELAGVTSLRHLPSQLKEMSRLIDKMLTTEFERYAAADLHRPLDAPEGVLEPERLISLVAGLLRQNHLSFLEVYKLEAVTAAQAVLKQLLIEQLADVEDDSEQCLTGSGEATPNLDSSHWLRVLALASDALKKLISRVRDVHDMIKQTAQVSAGVITPSDSSLVQQEKFLHIDDLKRVETKLKDLLVSICDYCNERLASLVSKQSDRQNITAGQINELSAIVEDFTDACEKICGRQSAALKAAFKIQAGNYVNKFHSQRKNKLTLLLDAERWKVADVPHEFQLLVDKLASGEVIDTIPNSPTENNNKNFAACLVINDQKYVTVGTVLMLIRLVCEYCVCAHNLPLLATVVYRNLAELLRTFNSRSCQLVLGAGALKTAGLKTITSTNLALTSRALQLVLWLVPHIRAHFSIVAPEAVSSLDTVEKDVGHHIQQLETKVLSIMNSLFGESLNEWDAKPPVPSKVFRNISKHLTKLHEAVSSVLPAEQVTDVYEVLHKNFKCRLRDQLFKMNIQNNGGPQHGVVTQELTFYIETLRNINVISEKYLSDKAMEDIWLK